MKSLFGSLGGALSLYLGVAVVMIFELVELIIDIGLNLWRKKMAALHPFKEIH